MSTKELSIGELEALVLKACRGAGYSWGLSQEAGRAAAWLAIRGLPSADLFAFYLSQINGVNPESLMPTGLNTLLTDNARPRCPVMTGALISDHGKVAGTNIETGPVFSPAIILPFVAGCAKSAKTGLSVKVDGVEVWLNGAGELTSLPQDYDQFFDLNYSSIVNIACLDECDGVPVTIESRRAVVSESQLQKLETLAYLTYVPASDQSRSGAGAGLTDND